MRLKTIASIFALTVSMSAAQAANFSFTGNFTYDNDVKKLSFTVGTSSLVTLRSWSYAGGTNAAGATIERGGFDSIFALFASNGLRIGEQDDAGCPFVAADDITGNCWDTRYETFLGAGTYTVTIQQYENFSAGPNLSDGFEFDGPDNRNFRNGFYDDAGDIRTSHWAFDILNVDAASEIPEPGPLALLGLGALGLAAARRRKPA